MGLRPLARWSFLAGSPVREGGVVHAYNIMGYI